jgi:hemerythrin
MVVIMNENETKEYSVTEALPKETFTWLPAHVGAPDKEFVYFIDEHFIKVLAEARAAMK